MTKVAAYELDPDYHTPGDVMIPGVAGVFGPGLDPVRADAIGIDPATMDEWIADGRVPLRATTVDDGAAKEKPSKDDLLARAAELGLDLPKSTTVKVLSEAISAAEDDAATASVPTPPEGASEADAAAEGASE